MNSLEYRIKKVCGRCGKKYSEHKDYDDKGIKLCIKCYIDFFTEQKILRGDTKFQNKKN